MSSIWLPSSAGMVNIRVWRLNQAAAEYDPRLMVGRNEQNGFWTVYIKNGADKPPFPVLALTRDEADLPHPDDLKRKLYEMDSVRHGEEMLHRINRQNEALEKANRYAADQATELAAEALKWGYDRMTNDIHRKGISVKLNDKAKNRQRMTSGG